MITAILVLLILLLFVVLIQDYLAGRSKKALADLLEAQFEHFDEKLQEIARKLERIERRGP